MVFNLRVILLLTLLGSILMLQTISVFIIYFYVLFSILIKKRSSKFYMYLIPLICIILLGFIFAFSNHSRDALRDIFYFTTPLFLILFGAIISEYIKLEGFVRIITYFGIIYSFYFIISLIILNLQWTYSESEYRGLLGTGSILNILSFYFLLFNKVKDKFLKLSFIRLYFLAIILLALFLFNSRTYLICFALFFFYFFQLFTLRKKITSLIISFSIIAFFFSLKMFDDNNFYLKILNSFDEISITNGFELNANNSNYRSFESFAAIDTYLAGNWINYMVGHGFGKLVDLKIEIELASQDWQFIPVLHNGFMYILVKTGLLGILFFLLFFIKLYPAKDFKILPSEYDYLILVIKSLIVCCLVTNFVVSSFFNLEMEFLLICLGAFFNYFKRLSLYYVQ